MIRVHSEVSQANEIVFVDTTSHIYQTNSALTMMLCDSPVGTLPLACIITSNQTENCYYQGKFVSYSRSVSGIVKILVK